MTVTAPPITALPCQYVVVFVVVVVNNDDDNKGVLLSTLPEADAIHIVVVVIISLMDADRREEDG